MASFKRECSVLRARLNVGSSFLDEMKLFGFFDALYDCMTKLVKQFEEKDQDGLHREIESKVLSLVA